MSIARQETTLPDPVITPGVKSLLVRFVLGRLGLRAAGAIRSTARKLRDPIQQRTWVRRFALPVRNAILLNRPLNISVGETFLRMAPRGSTAADSWAGLRFESREVSFLCSVLKPGMIFFDVGTNAGLFAISAAKKIGAEQVFAFEPCSSTCELLKENLRLNGVTNVHVEQAALGELLGKALLQVNARGKDGLNTLGRAAHPDSHVVGLEEVRVTTLDTFLRESGVPRVDVMKVDIEGAELMMFRGARQLLERADAPLILYEGYGILTRGFDYHPVELLWFLESCGYSLFALNSETGEVSELNPDYAYDSMVVAAKPGHPWLAARRTGSN